MKKTLLPVIIASLTIALIATSCSGGDDSLQAISLLSLLEAQRNKLDKASAPTDVAVTASPKQNYAKVTWTSSNESHNIYYSKTNDHKKKKRKYVLEGNTCEVPLSSSGTWYFWVTGYKTGKSDSNYSKVASYDFTYTPLTAPASVTATSALIDDNSVKVAWTSTGAVYYWVYWNSTNDSATATRAKTYASEYSLYEYINLPQPGTYYFWVKSADSNDADSPTSGFSAAATYTYTQQ